MNFSVLYQVCTLYLISKSSIWKRKVYKLQSLIAFEGYKNSTLKNLLHPAKSLFSLKNLLRKKLVFEKPEFLKTLNLAFSGLEIRYSTEIPKS